MTLIRVNDYEIKEEEILSELYKLCNDRRFVEPDEEIILKAVDNLVSGSLILQESRNKNVTISEDEVEQELLELMVTFNDEEAFRDFLRTVKSTPEILKTHIENKLMIRNYLKSEMESFCECDEKQLRNFYEENLEAFRMEEVIRVSHILIKPEMGMEKALQVRANIKTREDFNRVVGCCSDCPSCSQAGDLGYIAKGVMVPEFDEIAFSLEMGEISQPVTSSHGYHIILLTDRKKWVTLPFEDIKDVLKKGIKNISKEYVAAQLIKNLREKADVYIAPDIVQMAIDLWERNN